MFLRATIRKKDGKQHRYYSVVENRRVGGGRTVQRHVLYLGEINDSQELGWRKSIEAFEDGAAQPRPLSLFPEDRCEGIVDDGSIVRLKLKQLRLVRPRTFGGCWLALLLWRELALDRFWNEKLPQSRKGTPWDQVLFGWWLIGCCRRAANGGCIGNGLAGARWPIFWARTSAWPKATSFTRPMIFCLSTSKPFSTI